MTFRAHARRAARRALLVAADAEVVEEHLAQNPRVLGTCHLNVHSASRSVDADLSYPVLDGAMLGTRPAEASTDARALGSAPSGR